MHPAAHPPLCCGMRTQTAAQGMQCSRRHTCPHTSNENMLSGATRATIAFQNPPAHSLKLLHHMLLHATQTPPKLPLDTRVLQRPNSQTHQHTACGCCTICHAQQHSHSRHPCTVHVSCRCPLTTLHHAAPAQSVVCSGTFSAHIYPATTSQNPPAPSQQ
jgi:hypothetical protein